MSSLFLFRIIIVSISIITGLVASSTQKSTATLCDLYNECICSSSAHYYFININCTLNDDQDIELDEKNLPESLKELTIVGGQNVRIQTNSFRNIESFEKLLLMQIERVQISRFAFADHQSLNFFIDIIDCYDIDIESESFVNMAGPLTINFEHIANIRIRKEAFSWLLMTRFNNVTNLELDEKAFVFQQSRKTGRHGVATSIVFFDVVISRIPKNCFGSTISELRLIRSKITEIESDAISANTISALIFINCSIEVIQKNAFSDNTLLSFISIENSWIDSLNSQSIQSAIDNLTISFTRIKKIERGALNITVSKVLIDKSTFDLLQPKSITFNDVNHFRILNSTFFEFKSNAIRVSTTKAVHSADIFNFEFFGNEFYKIGRHSLTFLIDIADKTKKYEIKENFFEKNCSCRKSQMWLSDLFARGLPHNFFIKFIDLNFCQVEDHFVDCFMLKSKLINMKQYTKQICHNESQIASCRPFHGPIKLKNELIDSEPILPAFQNRNFWSRPFFSISTNRTAIVSIGLILILLAIAVFFLYRFPKHQHQLPFDSYSDFSSSRFCWLRKCFGYRLRNASNDIVISTIDKRTNRGASVATNDFDFNDRRCNGTSSVSLLSSSCRPKQSMPNELNSMLLETLRSRLNDPKTFDEARDMIEKLYDRFIVENEYNGTPTNKSSIDDPVNDNDEDHHLNDNRNFDETQHYYEELSTEQPSMEYEELEQNDRPKQTEQKTAESKKSSSFLRFIEEKFRFIDQNDVIVDEYSDPSDVQLSPHIYSELPNVK